MIQNMMLCRAELSDIHEYDGMTTSCIFATKPGQNVEEDIGSIFYVIMIFQVMKTSKFFILPISE